MRLWVRSGAVVAFVVAVGSLGLRWGNVASAGPIRGIDVFGYVQARPFIFRNLSPVASAYFAAGLVIGAALVISALAVGGRSRLARFGGGTVTLLGALPLAAGAIVLFLPDRLDSVHEMRRDRYAATLCAAVAVALVTAVIARFASRPALHDALVVGLILLLGLQHLVAVAILSAHRADELVIHESAWTPGWALLAAGVALALTARGASEPSRDKLVPR